MVAILVLKDGKEKKGERNLKVYIANSALLLKYSINIQLWMIMILKTIVLLLAGFFFLLHLH